MSEEFQKIRLQVMWDRLIAVVEEQARTRVRVAFSTSAREAGDVSAGVFSLDGEMLAQAVTGTPGHVNSMARSVKHFLAEIPIETMRPGDAYLTNDPWKGTGHLLDITVVSPTFLDGRCIALFACTAHIVDIGGNGPSPESKDVHSEGLFLPIMPLCREGRMDHWLLKLIRANVREPDRLEGDVYALVACNETGSRQLLYMMSEYRLSDLNELSRHILEASDRAMAEAISKLPNGTWQNSMRIDGFEAPVDLVGTVTIEDDVIRVDYTGTSGVSKFGINCPMCYCDAYTSFGVKCVVAPSLPNNSAVLARIIVTAPEGTIVNAPYPCAVTARSVIGQMLPDVVFGCFDQAISGRVPAEGTGMVWSLRIGAGRGISNSTKPAFISHTFQSGGIGAHPKIDGLSATPFPAGVKAIAVEVTEATTPLVIWRKELRPDSGGAGYRRGGLGQVMEIGSDCDEEFAIFARFERVVHAPRGRRGGENGATGVVSLKSGKKLKPKGVQIVPAGDRLIVEMPGGGGFGDPTTREPERVAEDMRKGFISADSGREVYKVAVGADFAVDHTATELLRTKGQTS
jgi:N-methylhydantoinase B